MARAGPRKLHTFGTALELTVVRTSQQPTMQMKTVDAGWDIFAGG